MHSGAKTKLPMGALWLLLAALVSDSRVSAQVHSRLGLPNRAQDCTIRQEAWTSDSLVTRRNSIGSDRGAVAELVGNLNGTTVWKPRTCMNAGVAAGRTNTCLAAGNEFEEAEGAFGGQEDQDLSKLEYLRLEDFTDGTQTSEAEKKQEFNCKEGQEKRDWFIAIKKPNSFDYAFISSRNPLNWKYAGDIRSQGPVFDTMEQARLYPTSALRYSDKPPPNSTYLRKYGHLKGLLMRGGSGSFWMMFSARHFPHWNPAGNILEQDNSNAQSFICISVESNTLTKINDTWLAPSMPRYQAEVDLVPQPGPISVNQFYSKGGNSFKIFVKPKNSNAECIYRHIRGHYTNSNGFRVQSWLLNRNEILPEQNEVTHVKNVTMAVQGQEQPWQWNSSVDHSKWCVSNSGQTVCLADLNRVTGHLEQGGAAVCFGNSSVWKAFDGLLKVP